MRRKTVIKLFHITFYSYYLYQVWYRFVLPRVVRFNGVDVGSGVRFYGSPIISKATGSTIRVGDRSKFCSVAKMAPLGVNHAVVLRTLKPGATLTVGRDTGMSGGAVCAAVKVDIGNQCLIGANVTITDTDFHTINPIGRYDDRNLSDVATAPVVIEDNVFIGMNAIILKGVRVGRNSIVGAGAVVTKDVPPDSIVGGNPARLLGHL